MNRQWRRLLIVGMGVALLAAACSSSKKAASTATTAVAGSTGSAGSSGSGDIVVEGLAQLAFYPGVDAAFQARITRFNNQGGLNGRKIKFLGVQDTGNDPAKALSEAQAVVLKDKV